MSEYAEAESFVAPQDSPIEAALKGARLTRPCRPEETVSERLSHPSSTVSSDGRAARLAKFKREQVIVDYLNRGVSVAEIAARCDVGEKRMRAIIREILARRMPASPAEFAAIQVSRLNEALLVAYSAMGESNLKAVDRVVRIVRELDRYHGFVAAERRRPAPSRSLTDEERPGIPLQDPEKIESAPDRPPAPTKPCFDRSAGPAAAAAALPNPSAPLDPDARFCRQAEAEPSGATPAYCDPQSGGRPENPAQSVENLDSAPGQSPPRRPRETGGPAAAAGEVSNPSAHPDPSARLREPDKASFPGIQPACRDPKSDSRPGNPAQAFKNIQFAPGAGAAPPAVPATPDPNGFRRVNVQMIPNGVMAC